VLREMRRWTAAEAAAKHRVGKRDLHTPHARRSRGRV
jgi:hypothetical protein